MSSLVDTPEYQAVARFIALTVKKRELEAELKEIKNSLYALQPSLLSYYAAAGLKSLTLNGYAVQQFRQPWIYPMTGVSRQQVCEALKIAGLGRMVKENYSTESLTAYLKQLEERAQLLAGLEPDDRGKPGDEALRQLLHPALADIMHVKAAYSLQVRRKEDLHVKTQRHEPDYEYQGDEANDQPDA